jgi:hypothetical protein
MFRLWAKVVKDNRLVRDMVVEDGVSDTRTHKVHRAIDEVCRSFDLGKPIWLDVNQEEFKKGRKTRFRQDSFMEKIPFDYLEIHVIEEDA